MLALINQYKLTIFTSSVVVTLSLMSSSELPSTNLWDFKGLDKLVHIAMYSMLSFFLFFEKNRHKININRQPFSSSNIYPIAILIIAGGIIEFIQPIIANRSRELMDFFANSSGVFIGFYLHVWLRIRKDYKAKKSTKR
jgi:VanZ family protein